MTLKHTPHEIHLCTYLIRLSYHLIKSFIFVIRAFLKANNIFHFFQPLRIISDPSIPSRVDFTTPAGKPAQTIKIKVIPAVDRTPRVCGLSIAACFQPSSKSSFISGNCLLLPFLTGSAIYIIFALLLLFYQNHYQI
jgi:hypothetical protein